MTYEEEPLWTPNGMFASHTHTTSSGLANTGRVDTDDEWGIDAL